MELSAIEEKPSRTVLDRAPLVPVVAALAVGIVTGRYAPSSAGLWAVVGAAGILLVIITFRRGHLGILSSIGVGVIIFGIGAVSTQTAWLSVADDHVITYTAEAPNLATLQGQIITSPVTYTEPPDPVRGYQRPPRTSFILRATHIRTNTGYTPTSGLVRVTVEEPARHLLAGARVELLGWIGRYRNPDNPGQYDLSLARRKDRTPVWLTVAASDGAIVLGGADRPWYARMFWHVRAASRQHLLDYGDDRGHVLNALIIGQRHPALRDLNRTMARAGIAHFMSISGLHLGIFLGFAYLLCRVLMLPVRRSAIVVLILLGAYVLLAEPRPALLRSAVMAAGICLATIFNRRYFLLNALAGAGVVLLAIDPLQLFQPGFQLSFTIVGGIILLHRAIRRLLFGRWVRRRGLMVFRGEQRVRRWVYYQASNWLMDLVAISVGAFIVAAPLVARYFGIFSPFAPVLSLLLLPLLVGVLVPGYLSMALTWPVPNLSYWIGLIGAKAAGALGRVVESLGSITILNLQLRPVGTAWVLLCYATLALLVLRRRIYLGRVFAAAAVAVLTAATVYTQLPAKRPPQAELHVLAVGAGQCTVLHTPSGRTYIFDAGTQSGFDIYDQILKPFLRHRGLPNPSAVFVSHANTDHFNALPALVSSGRVDRVYLNHYFGREQNPNEAVVEFMRRLQEANVSIVRLRAGETVKLDERTSVEVLWPPAQVRSDLSVNDTSLILRIICDDKSVLLTGDLDQAGQAELAQSPQALRCDALLLPHHGGWETALPHFVRAVDPRTVLVSCARSPSPPAHGSKTAGEFYGELRTGYRYYSTSRNGWICVRFGGGRIDVTTMR